MTITVKHSKVSTIPDDANTDLVRPSDWNADHTLVGTIDVPNGGTGATTLTGYVKGNGTSAMTAVATVPSTDITGLGTMSTQNANAVAITGGTINGTTIGATTPSTVNATTLSGETGVLRGTGQNLLTRSQLIGGTDWQSVGSATASTNAVVAPDSTTTASTLTVASGGYYRQITGVNSISSGATYTFSCYVKASASGGAANTRLTTNNVNAWNTGFSTRFALTSSWQRVSVTGTITGSACYAIIGAIDATGTNDALCAGNVDVWGAQLEIASSVGTYIPTTTTAVYGTPTLSFSGVSTIGLQSNGALFLQPAGTGAIQAQATTSTTAGGNVRGANAVDWQTARGTANQVASSAYSVVGGGQNNIASNAYCFVGGGLGNTASGIGASSVGGNAVLATGTYSVGGGGNTNTVSGYYGAILSGQSNTAAGYYNFVGGGFTNSGTSGSSVTTQVTTAVTSGSTSVTLSGSNANIKVGQLIIGTGIAVFTYVAAISGTSLTLSQNATATGTPTLSFFTPHGVVVGGGNNQATGSYSFIGGGGDAGTAANRNVASGAWSVVCGGQRNTASGSGSFIGGGGTNGSLALPNNATGDGSVVVGGFNNTASGFGATVSGGFNNTSNGGYSNCFGGSYGFARAINSNNVFSTSGPVGTVLGVSQAALLVLGVQTTDATATALRSDTAAAGTTNQVILPNNSAYFFRGEVISGKTAAGDTKGWTIEGVIKRGANAASTALVGTPTVVSTYADVGAATWDIAVTADTTNGGIRVTFTGQAATTIRTVARINTVEMTF